MTIRASLSGKTSTLPSCPDRSGIIFNPEHVSQLNKAAGGKSKSYVSGASKAKTVQATKRPDEYTAKHNLALANLRLSTRIFHTAVRDSAAISNISFTKLNINLFCSRPEMCSVIKAPLRVPSFWLDGFGAFRFGYFCIFKGNSTDRMHQSLWSWLATLHPYTSCVRPPVDGPLRNSLEWCHLSQSPIKSWGALIKHSMLALVTWCGYQNMRHEMI